ncbi:hypothetical protein [Micromonospora profundi]|uniref:hypothetical protein n=1 Tax=Micromonospora profundi TaxID=1420889 RepID=UPI003659E30D
MTYLIALLAAALGVAGIVHGEADDSPGLQFLGAALVVGAVVFEVRMIRHGRRRLGRDS